MEKFCSLFMYIERHSQEIDPIQSWGQSHGLEEYCSKEFVLL
jgi:hypothetical protein